MPTQVNLRDNQAGPLSIVQADESLQHLSNLELISSNRELYTGGEYVVDTTCTLTLPTDGNSFALTVQSGTVTFTGATVHGVTSATESGPGRKVYGKIGSDWKVLTAVAAGNSVTSITDDATATADQFYITGHTNNQEITVTLPADMPNGSSYIVVRQGTNDLHVDPSGDEGIIPVGSSTPNTDGVTIDKDSGSLLFYMRNGNWRINPVNQP